MLAPAAATHAERPNVILRIVFACVTTANMLAPGCAKNGIAPGREPGPWGIPAAVESAHYQYTNRLIDSNDPYLLLHAHNPVDWYPWGAAAFAKARSENKPVFLSIGYSTCYWCHVAEKTIYSNPDIAKLMNQWFVNVKVDREQRPDVDQVYMLATEIMTQQGGWPNNIFLTPDLKPFYAGSYFPPESFKQLVQTIHSQWQANPQVVTAQADKVAAVMQQAEEQTVAHARKAPLRPAAWMRQTAAQLVRRLDPRFGGLSGGSSTKFPEEPSLSLLLDDYRLTQDRTVLAATEKTLDAMALGGIYDQLGDGFYRYSTEPTWSIPHFEKMLYDNAQLLDIYARAYKLTHVELYRQVARNLQRYLTQDMMDPDGGFFTAQDSQVNGVEGASYLWTRRAIASVLGNDAAKKFFDIYAVTPMHAGGGVFFDSDDAPGVLRVRLPITDTLSRSGQTQVPQMLDALAPLREKLLAVRKGRPQPARDEKLVVSLNGLAIGALATTGSLFHDSQSVAAAKKAAARVWSLAYDPATGALQHEIFRGKAQTAGFLEDYALLGDGLMSLFDATNETVWRERARILANDILQRFYHKDGALSTAAGVESLPISPEDQGDIVYPSGTSAALELFLQLGATGDPALADVAARAAGRLGAQLRGQWANWPVLVTALNDHPLSTRSVALEAIQGPAESSVSAIRPDATYLLGTAGHVHAGATAVAVGASERVLITLLVDKGYHINANPASFDYLIPTSVAFDDLSSARTDYPAPTRIKPAFAPSGLDVYEGTVMLTTIIPLKLLHGRQSVRATVTAQACTDQACLRPAKIPLTVEVPTSR